MLSIYPIICGLILTAALVGPAAGQDTPYVFSQGFDTKVPAPRGGTTQGAPVELDPGLSQAFKDLQAPESDGQARDRRAILALAGEYRTRFEFVETASLLPDYQRDPQPYRSWATEYVFVLSEAPDLIRLQHILVMVFENADGSLSEPLVTKHWRQDWHWQPATVWRYRGDRIWAQEPVAGRRAQDGWKQAVYQVDDSPRYETVGRWRHMDGVSQWRSEFFLRPLPRRERSVRDDYDALGGRHSITVTPHGWTHAQDNRKLKSQDDGWRAIALETGLNRYRRIRGRDFAPGRAYWEDVAPFWAAVRAEWRRLQASHERLRIRHAIDGDRLFAKLFAASEQVGTSPEQLQEKVAALIAPYVEPAPK